MATTALGHTSAVHGLNALLRRTRTEPAYGAYLLLRAGFAVLPVLFGVDKFVGVLTDWQHYLAPWVVTVLPVTAHQAMLAVGVIEIAAGVAVAIKPRYAALIVAA